MWFLFVGFWEREFKQLARIEIHGDFGSETEREDDIQSERERMEFNKNEIVLLIYIIKKIVGSQLGLPGSSRFRVNPPDRPGFAEPNLKLVFSLTRPGSRPGSTRRAGRGFKTSNNIRH